MSPRRAQGLLGVALLVLGAAVWEPLPVGVWHDDGVYVLVGKTLAEGDGLRYGGVVGEPPATKFPPLYPAVVAAVWSIFPDFPGNVRLIVGLNVALMALAGALFAVLCRSAVGLPLGVSIGLAGATWTSVDLWRVAVLPLSEPLFIVALLAVLLAAHAWASSHRESFRSLPATVFLALGCAIVAYVRTIGVAVGAAAVIAAVSTRRRRRAGVLAVVFGAALAPWMIWSSVRTTRIPPTFRDILGSYSGFLTDRFSVGGGAILTQLPARALDLADWCLAVLLPAVSPGVRLVLGALLIPMLVLGFVELIRRSRITGFTAILLLVALWLWPFVDRRLMAPMVPWLALALWLGALRAAGTSAPGAWRSLARTWRDPRAWAIPGLFCWAVWFGVTSLVGLSRGWHDAAYRLRAPRVLAAVEAVETATAPTSIVGAPEAWAAIHLYSGRTVVPSAPFDPGATEAPVWGTPREQYRLWAEAGVEFVLVEHGGRVHGAALDRIEAECGEGTLDVTPVSEGAWLVRLGWDAVCRDRLVRTP